MTHENPPAARQTKFRDRIRRVGAAIKRFADGPQEPVNPVTPESLDWYLFHEINMSGYPDYYSGIGAEARYVGDGRLYKGYKILVARNGTDAANNYAQMLLDMYSLAPSNVVRAIRTLAGSDWQYDPGIIKGKQDPHPFDMPTDTDAPAVIELYEGLRALGPSSKPDETAEIKTEFIEQLGEAGVTVVVEGAIARIILDTSE